MKVPGKNFDDGTMITVDDLNVIFGTKSKRRYIFEQVNSNGKTLGEVKSLLGISNAEAEKAYFSAYMRCKEYSLYKNDKTSVRYLKAIRKLDKKTANQLLKCGIYDLSSFRGKNITQILTENEVELPVEPIYELCSNLNIQTTYSEKSIVNESADDVIDKVIVKMINKFGKQRVFDAFERRRNESN
jgi:hypothetical protein